ncbi:MAG: hypothetical protein HY054_04365 [Proteobacteria bacterium]|nr:hypothetical protein [Pseudomonadota bacterium]
MDASQIAWPSEDADSDSGMMEMHHDRPTTFAGRLIAWLGAWHPAIVHFPVALLLTAAFLELAAAMRGKPVYAASNKIILGLAVLSAFVAAPMGWADAGLPAPDDKWFLTWHRWIGTGLPVLLLLAWWLKRPPDEAAKKPSAPIYEVVLVLSVLVILAQAYLGGNITHGEDHLVF